MERYENLILDEERALYGLNGAQVVRCVFEGPADGESALKECRDVHLDDCDLRLRYPPVSYTHLTLPTMAVV